MVNTVTYVKSCPITTGQIITNDGVKTGSLTHGYHTTDYFNRNTDPDYRVKIAKKQDASLPYIAKRYKGSFPLLYSSSRNRPGVTGGINVSEAVNGETSFGNIDVPPSNSLTIAADDIALKRLKGKLANDIKDFKALVPLAELKESYGLLGQVLEASTDLIQGLVALKHGNVRNAASAASKAWLTFSFGVSPTISDLNNLYESINAYINRTDVSNTYFGKAETDWFSISGTPSSRTACNSHVWDYGYAQQCWKYQVQYTAGVRMRLKSANNYGVGDHFGLNFGELVPSFWELIPFSWVVDYFSTTGDFLSDLWSSDAGNTIYCNKSVKLHVDESRQWKLRNVSPLTKETLSSTLQYTHTKQTDIFQRSVLAALPHRSFRFKTQSEIAANSVNRLLNLTSLLLA